MTPEEIKAARADQEVTVTVRAQSLNLRSTWGLFSPRELDAGSRLLLERLELPQRPGARILDLGCGYGPIGLTLARCLPDAEVLMVDKDFVAVDYANANAERNGLTNAQAMLSNGFSRVTGEFDLIVSNVPAKVGKELWSIMLHDAHVHLRPGGEIWFVSINGLRDFFKRSMKAEFGNYEKVKQGPVYTVSRATRAPGRRPAPN
ncbi:MAG: class I SAM-dependent methyltransferase [Halothiobacillaceae bacterium]